MNLNTNAHTQLRSLSNQALHQELVSLSSQERKLTLRVLHHLREAEVRMLYAERGYSSLFEYVVSELHYSESSAQRRISAMRALRDLPDLESKVETGELKVTQLSQVQSFLRNEKKEGKTYSVEAKRELILETVGKSARETEKILAERNPAFAFQDQVKVVTPELTQITFTADDVLIEKLAAIKDRFAHQLPAGATPSDVIRFMADVVLKQDPMKKKGRAGRDPRSETKAQSEKRHLLTTSVPICTSAAEVNLESASKAKASVTETATATATATVNSLTSLGAVAADRSSAAIKRNIRYIPAPVKRLVWLRDSGRCSHRTKDGKTCGSRHRLQIDHVLPFALGGSSTDPENLRLLCWTHNALRARLAFGRREAGPAATPSSREPRRGRQ